MIFKSEQPNIKQMTVEKSKSQPRYSVDAIISREYQDSYRHMYPDQPMYLQYMGPLSAAGITGIKMPNKKERREIQKHLMHRLHEAKTNQQEYIGMDFLHAAFLDKSLISSLPKKDLAELREFTRHFWDILETNHPNARTSVYMMCAETAALPDDIDAHTVYNIGALEPIRSFRAFPESNNPNPDATEMIVEQAFRRLIDRNYKPDISEKDWAIIREAVAENINFNVRWCELCFCARILLAEDAWLDLDGLHIIDAKPTSAPNTSPPPTPKHI